jgi:hypothetical protein
MRKKIRGGQNPLFFSFLFFGFCFLHIPKLYYPIVETEISVDRISQTRGREGGREGAMVVGFRGVTLLVTLWPLGSGAHWRGLSIIFFFFFFFFFIIIRFSLLMFLPTTTSFLLFLFTGHVIV